jgi:hypothetical protein
MGMAEMWRVFLFCATILPAEGARPRLITATEERQFLPPALSLSREHSRCEGRQRHEKAQIG